MPREYTSANGTFTFPGQECQIQIRNIQRDRFGRFFCDIAVLMPDGMSHLALDHGDLSSGRFRNGIAGQAAQRNSRDTIKIENLLIAAFLALQDDPDVAGEDSASPPVFQQIDEFLKDIDPARNDLVTGLLEYGNSYLIAARYKTGKTILLMNLALAASRGAVWLGREVRQGPVFWLQLEDSPRTIARRWQKMARGRTPDLSVSQGPWHTADANLEPTIKTLMGASLIMVDPIISAASVEHWSDMTEVREAYDFWRIVSRRTGAVVVITAHHRKMSGDAGDQVAGSHQAGASVDGIIEMRRDGSGLKKGERRISFIGRDWADLDEEVVSLNTDTLVFEPVGSYQERKEETDQIRAEADAVKLVATLDGKPMRKQELREMLGWDAERFNLAYSRAMQASQIHEGKAKPPGGNRKVVFVYPGPRPEQPDMVITSDAAEALAALPDKPPGLTYEEWEAKTGWGRRRLGEIRAVLGNKIAQEGESRNPQNPTRFWRM